jgi:uncharacterized protein (TIGR03790 family)
MRHLVLFLLSVVAAAAAEPGSTVVVVYNSDMPESKQVADYYAERRNVPGAQVLGLPLPKTEAISRADYVEKLQKPFLKKLEAAKLHVPAKNGPDAWAFRYVLLCYGVPTKILPDLELKEDVPTSLQTELRRTDASVDSQLACITLKEKPIWTGPTANPFFAATNAAVLQPANGALMVTRLDGPSPAIAKGLVDKAIEAETNGLWGRAYIDARGITNGGYKLGDDWMRATAEFVRQVGYETELDEKPTSFPASYPMSQIGIYAGWYEQGVSGPFARPEVEFVPGAFAYHLHSFNARVLRTATEHWTGPLLAKGATITFGSVEEPYLFGTPDFATFCTRFIYLRFSFGEAAYVAQNSLSWQTIAVGDPLYRPYWRGPDQIHADLERRQSKWLEWSHLRVINLNIVAGYDVDDCIQYLEALPLTRTSAILTEKLGDIYWGKKKLSDALNVYEKALKLDPSPQQKIRLLLNVANRRTYFGAHQVAYDYYRQFLKEFPDYPDLLAVYQKMLPLAEKLNKKEDAERWQKEIQRLTPAPAPKS